MLGAKRDNSIKGVDLMRGFIMHTPPNGVSRINQEEWDGDV
jgi:hypothetical protein